MMERGKVGETWPLAESKSLGVEQSKSRAD